MLSFDEATRHPSLFTAIPVFGTMLLIRYAQEREPVTALLASRPFVAAGLISYSLYLWHFSIFAFARMRNEQADSRDKMAWIAVAIALSVVTWLLIERPARNKTLLPRKRLVVTLFLCALALSGAFAYLFASDGASFRVQKFNRLVASDYFKEENGNREYFWTHKGCWLGWDTYDVDDPFRVCKSAETLRERNLIMVVGDSHAAGLVPGLIDAFGADAIIQRVVNGCRPYIDNAKYKKYRTERQKEFCINGFRAAVEDMEALQPSVIMFSGNYKTLDETDFYVSQFNRELNKFRDRVIVVGPLPRGNIVRMLRERFKDDPLHFEIPAWWTPSSSTFKMEAAFKAVVKGEGIAYLSPVDTFCRERQCRVRVDSAPDGIVTWDFVHLTHKASKYLVEKNLDLIRGYLE